MQNIYHYKPITFFLTTLAISLAIGFAAAYVSSMPNMVGLQLIFMLMMLCVPCSVALAMIYGSKNKALQQDFWKRLQFSTLNNKYVLISTLLMPLVLFLATVISILFGYSTNQFQLSPAFEVLQMQSILGLIFVFVEALVEELGWRGYGVDSLRSRFNLFTTSLLFAASWALWHLPLFFIKGYYQYTLWHTSSIYTLNFFVSMLPGTILLNWLYYKNNRNIIIATLFHAMLNLFAMLFQTEQFTKCVVTVLLLIVAGIIIMKDKKFFFSNERIS